MLATLVLLVVPRQGPAEFLLLDETLFTLVFGAWRCGKDNSASKFIKDLLLLGCSVGILETALSLPLLKVYVLGMFETKSNDVASLSQL